MASETETTKSSDWIKWLAWLEKNKKRIAIWGGSGLAFLLIVVGIVYQQKMKEVRASEALSKVALPMPPGRMPAPGTADELLNVEREHPNTAAAARALLEAAGIRFVEGKYADAESLFSRFQNEYSETVWLPQAHLGFAASLAAQGKNSDALAEYEKLKKLYPNDAIANEVKLGLAGLYEQQQKPDEAYKLYQDLLTVNHPSYSGLGAQASVRQEALIKQYPELVKTNMPAITSNTFSNLVSGTNLSVTAGTNRTLNLSATNLLKGSNGPNPLTVITNVLKSTNAAAPLAVVTNALKSAESVPANIPTNMIRIPAPTPVPTPVTK